MKTDIEYAALVMGMPSRICNEWHNKGTLELYIEGIGPSDHLCWHPFNPLHDDGDSRRLERACMRWTFSAYGDGPIPEPLVSLIEAVVDGRYKGSDAEDNAAVYLWAVAIGKVIEVQG